MRQTAVAGNSTRELLLLPCTTMSQTKDTQVSIRVATAGDAPACGQICFAAFTAISQAHGFTPDFPSPEVAVGLLAMLFANPGFYCVVAESGGRIVGSNCMDERSIIFGIGPITVDSGTQNAGVGRKLMQEAIDRSNQRGAAGVRL